MCGILGLSDTKQNYSKFKKALDLEAHRGPDHEGIYQIDNTLFGHRRLKIIDLDTKANQPMLSKDNRFMLVFNGEIYNYLELKKNLLAHGYHFETHSDSEVLLYAFKHYGTKVFNLLNGMFAFAIYDCKEKKIYLARDHLGIKPLYYYQDANSFAFSSEVKPLLALFPEARTLDEEAISSYLAFRYPILNGSFFKPIKSLAAGHYMVVDENHQYKAYSYWSLQDHYKRQEKDEGEAFYINKLNELLQDSVHLQSQADVPLGSFLSGGVDSSLISALLARAIPNSNINAFTTGFKGDDTNEFPYAREVARHYPNIQLNEICLNHQDYLQTMLKLITLKGAPLSVPNEPAIYLMSLELKKSIKVVLSGEGADEIFGGYGRILRSAFDYERIKNAEHYFKDSNLKNNFLDQAKNYYGTTHFQDELSHFLKIYPYINFEKQKTLLNNHETIDSFNQKAKAKFNDYFSELENMSYENKIMYTFTKVHLPGLLGRLDHTTMAASIEARVPFLDYRIVEFAASIPLSYKLKWQDYDSAKNLLGHQISENYDTPKYILKKLGESFLPHKILYRKKQGFPMPLNKIFLTSHLDYTKEILLDTHTKQRGLYNIETIENLLKSKTNTNDMLIWMLLNLELFLRSQLGSNSI